MILPEMRQVSADSKSRWVKAPVANMVRYQPSGIYFARARVGGKLIRQSLKTHVLSVAKLKLRDLLAGEEQRVTRQKTIAAGKMTVGDAWNLFTKRLENDPDIKPSTKKYQHEIFHALEKSWLGFKLLDIKKINKTECLTWRSEFAAGYSATRVNGAVSLLRRMFEMAIEAGVRHDNPAMVLRRAKVRQKELILPEPEQFLHFVEEIETAGGSRSKHCADLVRFLSFGGFRITEAAKITWADCNFEKGELIVRGDGDTGTKNWSVRRVPMIPELRNMLERLKNENTRPCADTPVMQVRECQKAMNRAAKIIGMPRITHHDLRHLFATRCIESGVDIPTVSRWLGHKDGGALAMKVYGHLRDQHSVAMAQKVTFSPVGEKAIMN